MTVRVSFMVSAAFGSYLNHSTLLDRGLFSTARSAHQRDQAWRVTQKSAQLQVQACSACSNILRLDPEYGSRPLLSKLSLFNLYHQLFQAAVMEYDASLKVQTERSLEPEEQMSEARRDCPTYHDTKKAMMAYQTAKSALQGPQGPFCGWVKSGAQWERFNKLGMCDMQE